MERKNKLRRIMYNWDGDGLFYSIPYPPGEKEIVKTALEPFVDTHVDVIIWSLGNGQLFHHNTKKGELYGDNVKDFGNAGVWRKVQNSRHLRSLGTDAPEILVKHGHQLGFEIFLSMRMNDPHDAFQDIEFSSFKKEHPEYLLGVRDKSNTRQLQGMDRYRQTALNYAIPEVRQLMFSVIEEACQNYDIDGFQLDFMTFPNFFKQEEIKGNVPIMTEFVRKVRRMMDETGSKRKRRLELNVQVPLTFELSLKHGLDVKTWLDEGLIDILMAGRGYMPFCPTAEYVDAGHKAGCQVFATCNHRRIPEVTRALAAMQWEQGVDGLGVFNWYGLNPTNPDPFETFRKQIKDPVLNEIGDPECIARLDKRYVVDRIGGIISDGYQIFLPPAELPCLLDAESEKKTQTVTMIIGDDVERASKEGVLKTAKLSVKVSNLTDVDRISLTFNGHSLDESSYTSKYSTWYSWLLVEIPLKVPPLRQGENKLEVTIKHRESGISDLPCVEEVELLLNYKKMKNNYRKELRRNG